MQIEDLGVKFRGLSGNEMRIGARLLTAVYVLSRILDSAGERFGRCSVSDSLTTPIVQTATYFFKDTAELIAFQV